MRIDQDMVAYYLRKLDFDSKDSKWVFEMHFNEEHFFRKGFFLKGKTLFANDNMQRSNIGNPKENKITK